MNYAYIETLVKKSKDGDNLSKEKLADEFRPFIINLAKRTFIHSYEFQDIMNECYRILFRCVSLYNTDNHRFVAYATNGIKNSINDIIRKNLTHKSINGSNTLTLDDNFEYILKSKDSNVDDIFLNKHTIKTLSNAIDKLEHNEKELISFIFIEKNTIKSYAELNNISYLTALKKRKYILDKLFMYFHIENNSKMLKP